MKIQKKKNAYFSLHQGCDDDDENGDFGFNFVPDGGSQELNDSQPGVMISDAILDGTMLTGDKLIEEPRKVSFFYLIFTLITVDSF